MNIGQVLGNLWETSGFYLLFDDWRQIVMIVIACVFLYFAVHKTTTTTLC